jgi:hypothetical protein
LSEIYSRCVYYGVLPHDEADRLNKIVTERKRAARLGTQGSPSPQHATKKPIKKKKVVKVLKDDSYDDPDMIISSGGDGIGIATL